MAYDPDVHHRKSIRLPEFDYRTAGAYFITICAWKKECVFATPSAERIIRTAWKRAMCGGAGPKEYDFVVMPNHVHGVVWIADGDASAGVRARHLGEPAASHSETAGRAGGLMGSKGASPLRVERARGAPVGSLGARVAAFKAASARRLGPLLDVPAGCVWQRGYYEHIIRDKDDLFRIQEYVRDNPAKWHEDPDNPAVISATDSATEYNVARVLRV